MSSAPTVAAIIPTRNRADRLAGALESVFDQSYERVEAVIVDGGSTDRTPAVVSRFRETYGEGRITYVRNEEPRGLPAARNQAAERTDAPFLAFLDDDDRWHQSKIERQVAQFSEPGSEIALSYTGCISKTDTGRTIHTSYPTLEGRIFPHLLQYNYIGTPSRVMVSADVFYSLGRFDEELRYQEDWDFYLRLAKEYEIGCISDPLVSRFSHAKGMSKDVESQRYYRGKILNRYRSILHFYDLYDTALATQYRETGIDYSQAGDTAAGRREFWQALRHNWSADVAVLYALTLLGPHGFRFATELKRVLTNFRGAVG